MPWTEHETTLEEKKRAQEEWAPMVFHVILLTTVHFLCHLCLASIQAYLYYCSCMTLVAFCYRNRINMTRLSIMHLATLAVFALYFKANRKVLHVVNTDGTCKKCCSKMLFHTNGCRNLLCCYWIVSRLHNLILFHSYCLGRTKKQWNFLGQEVTSFCACTFSTPCH